MASETPFSSANLDHLIDTVLAQLQTYKANFTEQVNSAFTRLTPKDVIRLVIIAGAYCLLRPYLLKLGARFQARDHERELDHDEIRTMQKQQGEKNFAGVEIPEDTDESEGEATGVDWGKTATRRQRRVMRQLLEAEEKRRLEEEEAESDKELEQWMEK